MDDLSWLAGHSDIHPPDQGSCFTWNANDPLGQTGVALSECWFSRAPPQPGNRHSEMSPWSPLFRERRKTVNRQTSRWPFPTGQETGLVWTNSRGVAPPGRGSCLKVPSVGLAFSGRDIDGVPAPWSLTDGPKRGGDCSGAGDRNQSRESGFGPGPAAMTTNPGKRGRPPTGEPHSQLDTDPDSGPSANFVRPVVFGPCGPCI